ESAALTAPWLRTRRAYDLLSDQPETLHSQPGSPQSSPDDGLSQHQLGRIGTLQRNLQTYQHLLADPSGVSALTDQSLARAASQAWRGNRVPMSQFVRAQQLLLHTTDGHTLPLKELDRGDVIRVESNPQVTLTGSSAAVPATIVNTLDV